MTRQEIQAVRQTMVDRLPIHEKDALRVWLEAAYLAGWQARAGQCGRPMRTIIREKTRRWIALLQYWAVRLPIPPTTTRPSVNEAIRAMTEPAEGWVTLCKRTEDPKLHWIEQSLSIRGIVSRRNGESWHAPILEVRTQDESAAWAFLAERLPGFRRTIDDLPDNHPIFRGMFK